MNSNSICLVVGDDVDIRDLLCLILSSDSFKVRAEVTGAAGLKAAPAPDPPHQEVLGSPHPHDHRVPGPSERNGPLGRRRCRVPDNTPSPCLAGGTRTAALPSRPRCATHHWSGQVMMALGMTGLHGVLTPQYTGEECHR